MSISRKFIHLMLVLPLLIGAMPASAAPAATSNHLSVRLRNATIPWLFPLDSLCSEVPEGVTINPDDLSSDRVKVVIQKTLRDGTQRTFISDVIKGTASDESGGAYRFIYINVVTLDFDGSTVHAKMKDFFQLRGAAADYSVAFNWHWDYVTDSLEVVEVTDEHGNSVDIAVNPFPFATIDGVNEDPNIIPGSWQQVSTRGDPFNCDPL